MCAREGGEGDRRGPDLTHCAKLVLRHAFQHGMHQVLQHASQCCNTRCIALQCDTACVAASVAASTASGIAARIALALLQHAVAAWLSGEAGHGIGTIDTELLISELLIRNY